MCLKNHLLRETPYTPSGGEGSTLRRFRSKTVATTPHLVFGHLVSRTQWEPVADNFRQPPRLMRRRYGDEGQTPNTCCDWKDEVARCGNPFWARGKKKPTCAHDNLHSSPFAEGGDGYRGAVPTHYQTRPRVVGFRWASSTIFGRVYTSRGMGTRSTIKLPRGFARGLYFVFLHAYCAIREFSTFNSPPFTYFT